MIFITGDTHGSYERFSLQNFPEQKAMNKNDYVLILGDFGIWDCSLEQEEKRKWLSDKNFTTLFIDGNHENYDLLNTYPIESWKGGEVQFITPSIIHLMRGQIFTIDNFTFFTFGGARSHDISGGVFNMDDPDFETKCYNAFKRRLPYRVNHLSWWREEMPSENEMEKGIENLDKHGCKVDMIFSHCAPSPIEKMLEPYEGAFEQDKLTDYLHMISETTIFSKWFFGHYHSDVQLTDKFECLFREIVKLNDTF